MKRTTLGRVANETSFCSVASSRIAVAANARGGACPFALTFRTAILDSRYLVTSPEPMGNITNGMAISSAPSVPHGPLRAAVAKTIPTTEDPHDAHIAMRKLFAAFSAFQPQSSQ